MDELTNSLKVAFADTFAFYLKSANFHWNVEGILFPQLHTLLDTIYNEVYGSIDNFAENIRKIGSYTPASFSRLAELSTIEDERQVPEFKDMLVQLYQDNERVLESIKTAYDYAEQAGEHGLSNFLAERQDAHRKHGWMIRATLK
jgi:starvation-inducible DNA-binding protein